jgi:YbbR domain-containing protein
VKAALRWIVSNLPLMLLALVLAVLAWVVAAEEADPTRTERYPSEIPVVPSSLPEGMVIVGELDESVLVTVRAPESVWRSIGANDFSATVDLTGLEAGTHELPVEVNLRRQPSNLAWEPESLIVELAPWAEQSVPVNVSVLGDPALGYLMQVPVAIPRHVAVSGPETHVIQVVEATTQVSAQDAKATIEGEFPLQALDGEGQPVSNVTLTPAMVDVRVPIELSGYYSPLTVRVVYEGSPASGYRITYIAVEPSTVTVRGAPDVIAALPGYIETEPVDVEGAEANIVRQPALEVPPNVAVVSGQPVTVSVVIEAIQSSLTMEITPTLQGLDPALTATVSPETVEVFLSGPLAELEALEASDVHVTLDLFDLERGTHQVEPQVIVPEGLIAQSILPATVQVEILTPPTPTPVSTTSLSPIPTPTED